MKIGIGIPTLNRKDLLLPSLYMYRKDMPTCPIWVLDNGNQGISVPGVNVIPGDNLSVGASWNVLCKKIFESCDHALILNDDIYLGKKEISLISLASHKKNKDCIIKATPDWCAFIMPHNIYRIVGDFDECFVPAYYEDKSYEYRCKLKGVSIHKTPDLNPMIYKSSQTIEKAPNIFNACRSNKEKYIEMWGGEPGHEKYRQPYNQTTIIK